MSAPASPVRTAAIDIAPFALGVAPFGLAVGAAASRAGLSVAETLFGAVAMLAGAGQLVAVEAIGRDESLVTVVVAVVLVNLRFVLYGAGVASWFADRTRRARLALAYPVVDQTFFLTQQAKDAGRPTGWLVRYYVTATAILGGTFVAAQALAISSGATFPDGVGVHLAAPLAFVGLVTRAVQGRPELLAAALAAVGAVVAGPSALPVVVAGSVCLALLVERRLAAAPVTVERLAPPVLAEVTR